MTTYVLGAGASCHAGYPLASKLRSGLYDWLRQDKVPNALFRACIEKLNDIYGNLDDLESIVTELGKCPPKSRATALSKMERGNILGYLRYSIPEFFNDLRQAPSGLYEVLAQRVREDDVIITFNYDVALERELKRVGLWEITDGYGFHIDVNGIARSRSKVLKLHGSTNWFGQLFEGMRGFFQFEGNTLPIRPVILRSGDFEFLAYSKELIDPVARNFSEGAVIPTLIMPGAPKHFYVQSPAGHEWELALDNDPLFEDFLYKDCK